MQLCSSAIPVDSSSSSSKAAHECDSRRQWRGQQSAVRIHTYKYLVFIIVGIGLCITCHMHHERAAPCCLPGYTFCGATYDTYSCVYTISYCRSLPAFCSFFFLLGTDADRRECNYIRGPKLFRTCKVLLKLSRPASATTARQGGYSQRSSAAFAQRARQSRGCSSCADCKNSDERGKFPLHVLHRPPESV